MIAIDAIVAVIEFDAIVAVIEFDAIVAVIETFMFQDDEELKLEINSCIKNMPSKKNKAGDKNCLSNGGLKRQITTRYPSSKARETSFPDCLRLDLVPT